MLISQLIKGSKEKFFIKPNFCWKYRTSSSGQKFFGKKWFAENALHFLPKNFLLWRRCPIFSSKIWFNKKLLLAAFYQLTYRYLKCRLGFVDIWSVGWASLNYSCIYCKVTLLHIVTSIVFCWQSNETEILSLADRVKSSAHLLEEQLDMVDSPVSVLNQVSVNHFGNFFL